MFLVSIAVYRHDIQVPSILGRQDVKCQEKEKKHQLTTEKKKQKKKIKKKGAHWESNPEPHPIWKTLRVNHTTRPCARIGGRSFFFLYKEHIITWVATFWTRRVMNSLKREYSPYMHLLTPRDVCKHLDDSEPINSSKMSNRNS